MSMSISGNLMKHVRSILDMSLDYALTGKGARHGYNAYSPHALPAYIVAYSAVEALLNETMLGPVARALWRDSALWNLKKEALDKLELQLKLVIVPQMLVGKALKRDKPPFQDFILLSKIRNDVVHYKMGSRPKYVQPLVNRGVALSAATAQDDPEYPWPAQLSCTEGIRWAHNTACGVAHSLAGFVPNDQSNQIFLSHLITNFEPISMDSIIQWYKDRQAGEDLNRTAPA